MQGIEQETKAGGVRFYALTESAFWGYPLCVILFKALRTDDRVSSLDSTLR